MMYDYQQKEDKWLAIAEYEQAYAAMFMLLALLFWAWLATYGTVVYTFYGH